MRNALFATASLAFVSSPAMAADMLSVGVGGYMEQWFGYADRDDGAKGGFKNDSDAEIYFTGSMESDMGLKFGVDVQLEANNGPKEYTHPVSGTHNNPTGSTNIDESFIWVSGEFGRLELGARDPIHARTHAAIGDVGVGITGGDTQVWIPGAYFDTSGWWVGMGDNKNLIYITPRVSGLQLGISYGADAGSENKWAGAPTGNEDSVWAGGLNFQQAVGDGTFTFSLGHRNREGTAAEVDFMSTMAPATGETEMRLSQAQHAAHEAAWEKWEYLASTDAKNKEKLLAGDATAAREEALADIVNDGLKGRAAITAATSSMMKGDNDTFTNVGVGVGFGSFTFNVAYATRDRGSYMAMDMPMGMTSTEMTAQVARLNTASGTTSASAVAKDGFTGADGTNPAVYIIDTAHMFDHDDDPTTDKVAEAAASGNDPTVSGYTAAVNDPSNETWMGSTVVKNKAAEWDTWGVSVVYTDGPMALSLAHMNLEDGAGGDRTSTMFSARYTLAPGVDWRNSIFTVEDSTGQNLGGREARQTVNKGTAFVTGIRIGF